MEIDRSKISPMMQQYFEVKDKYTDCILFFRLGDFYEMFFDDAVVVSKALELTLTGRDCGLEEASRGESSFRGKGSAPGCIPKLVLPRPD